MTLRERIADEIQRQGPIPFSRYMELCLYEPELGYYSSSREQFGKAGDFYTSSDVHAAFGRLLARQFDQMWRTLDCPKPLSVLELGPGRGLFAQDALVWCRKKFPEFFDALTYTLVESSPALRQRLSTRFSREMAEGKVSIIASLDDLHSPRTTPTILFANEFFDALPVEVISSRGKLLIGLDSSGRFVETFAAPAPEELAFLDRYGVHPGEDERVEAPLLASRYMERIAAIVPRGFAVIIDYYYTREQLLAGCHRGTLTCYRRHSISETPYEAPGEQDITAHVNITALRAAALAGGFKVATLVTQAEFLIGIGEENQFADAFEDAATPQERGKVALQLKQLVTPAGMGEIFQVLLLGKGVEEGLFRQLSGMQFAR